MTHNIIIPWKGRNNYLRITLATLNEALRDCFDYPQCVKFWIINNDPGQPEPDILKDWPNTHFVGYHSNNSQNVYRFAIDFVFNEIEEDYVALLDADACVHPDYFDVLERALKDLEDFGIFSLFNEDCHQEPSEIYKENYHVRRHLSFFSAVVLRQAWNTFSHPEPGRDYRFGCIDGDFSTFLSEQTKFKVYTTVRSYVEHIGRVSQRDRHRTQELLAKPDNGENFARARRFYD